MKLAENPFAGVLSQAKDLVSQMTLEEKASFAPEKISGLQKQSKDWVFHPSW